MCYFCYYCMEKISVYVKMKDFYLPTLLIAGGIGPAYAGSDAPNIVLILADDMGYGDISL